MGSYVAASSPGGLLASSPPTRSPASFRAPAPGRPSSMSDARSASAFAGPAAAASGPSSLLSRSFGARSTPVAAAAAATTAPAAPSAMRPPPARPAAAARVCVGFTPAIEVPQPPQHEPQLSQQQQQQHQALPVAMSPNTARRATSLLSAALLEVPASPTPLGGPLASPLSSRAASLQLHPELLGGGAAPAGAFESLRVIPAPGREQLAPAAGDGDDAAPRLADLQAEHASLAGPAVAAAYALAVREREGARCRSGEPALARGAATARLMAGLGLPDDVVAAGLLHGAAVGAAAADAAALRGALPAGTARVAARAASLRGLSSAYRDNAASLEAAAMLELLCGTDDVAALLAALAERLAAMRRVAGLPRAEAVALAAETLDVHAVLANRLGAWALRAELEDAAFAALAPEEAAATAAALEAARGGAAGRQLAASVDAVAAALEAAAVPSVDVSGRLKNAYGVWRKTRQGQEAAAAAPADTPQPRSAAVLAAADAAAGLAPAAAAARRAALAAAVARVHDQQALRVVVAGRHDCYAALRVVQALWAPLAGRPPLKDYVRAPKANGYQSLHAAVVDAAGAPLEVQIRTPKMHFMAEYGLAAHWAYKEGRSGSGGSSSSSGSDDEDAAAAAQGSDAAAAAGGGGWLERLVAWKKWVAAAKLGVGSAAKVRPSGSPGCGAGDAALAGLAASIAAATAAKAAAAAGAGATAGDAVGAALDAACAGSDQQQQPPPPQLSDADARFAARFAPAPISAVERDARGFDVLVVGATGARIERVPAGCTAAQLLASSAGKRAAATPVAAAAAAARAVRVSINGASVSALEATRLRLRAGDHVELLPAALAAPPALPGTVAAAAAELGLLQMEPAIGTALQDKLGMSAAGAAAHAHATGATAAAAAATAPTTLATH